MGSPQLSGPHPQDIAPSQLYPRLNYRRQLLSQLNRGERSAASRRAICRNCTCQATVGQMATCLRAGIRRSVRPLPEEPYAE